MGKRTVGAVATAGILLLAAVIVALYQRRDLSATSEVSYAKTTTSINNFENTSSAELSQTTTMIKPLYIIGAWEDKLALFIPPDTSPNQVFDVYLPSLPEEEQQRLYDGIEVFDEQTLASLLEDYTS